MEKNPTPHEKRDIPRRKLRARELAGHTADQQTCFQTVVGAGRLRVYVARTRVIANLFFGMTRSR